MSFNNTPVKCCRCRHQHTTGQRVDVPSKKFLGLDATDSTCPRCGGKSYYDCTPQVAWCWASGLIEIGDAMPPDAPDGGGAIPIATGPKYALKGRISAVARHGIGASAGKLLVPGVPEAEGMRAKGDALSAFLAWCNKSKPRDGVVFDKGFK